MRKILDLVVRPFGLRVMRADQADMVYQHEYGGGYEEYRATQVFHNKRKLEKVWADEVTLTAIVDDLKAHGLGATGVCHGARNGYEVEFFRKALEGEIIGTDISETATQFPHMHVWDFQDVNPDWAGKFDFIYTNSLDQAMDPKRALEAWTQQLAPDGRIYIEHTMAHSPTDAGKMDPFGAHPMAMPYLFFTWGRGTYKLVDILEIDAKKNNRRKAWVFVLGRA
ncbi:MAG: class I SAM-dependent methyltransferase [Silicimonas sp.]|nr:class I SAM-dependent methyltransferase [Silicimonas sp.]